PPPPGSQGYPPPPPYGQPGYGAYPPPGPVGQEGAGVWIRFAARLIDGILAGIVVLLISLPLYNNDSYGIFAGVISGLIPFAYFVGFEVSQGWTPAKKLLGLSVHGPGGAAKPTAQQSAIRNAFMLLSVIPWVGWLLGLIADIVIAVTINSSPTKQGKHDELAGGTQVVKG
ncbi:RDD family protein, partial [Mycolicibacterium sphagni]